MNELVDKVGRWWSAARPTITARNPATVHINELLGAHAPDAFRQTIAA